jgi:predicted Rossmann-fold nucleotide-binding protein
MKVLVCGSRDYPSSPEVYYQLGKLKARGISAVITGGAKGADEFAHYWATRNGIEVIQFKADWQKHGRAAGPIRNQQMLDEGRPDLVVAFAGGRGTADMIRRAEAAGIPIERHS